MAAALWLRREWFLVVLAMLISLPLCAQDKESDEAGSKTRLAIMEQTIAGFEVRSDEIKGKGELTFAGKPLLRYSDPTRGLTEANVLLDASVWRLGESGRPTALVTLEIYRSTGERAVLSYEFASLEGRKFSLQHKQHEGVTWEATGSAVTMTPLAEAPKPAKSPAGRLTQMRQLARQFAVREKLLDDTVVACRLLAQPIDRYAAAEEGLVDGAIFAFANGTNPELGLVLECDAEKWSYGAVRLSAAETILLMGDRELVNFPIGDFRSTSGTYSANNHTLELK
jgi:hypothetical protein